MSIERINDFRRAVELAAAERREPAPHGVGLFADSVPSVYDANYVSIEEPVVDAGELATETDRVMEHCHHRRVVLEQGGDATAAALADRGYVRSTHIVFAHRREPDRRVDTSMVREVEFDRIEPVRIATTIAEPWGDDEIARQLNDAKRLIMRAVPTRFFAAIVDDRVAAYCEIRSDGRTAQIEDVEAVRAYRGRGLGRAIVQHALDEARRTHDVVFLEALADDWPRRLYAKLGFDAVGKRDFLTRFPHPLTRLRLRTPRLELRLPTVFELRELYQVAAAGIHDPEFMPFETAWTDGLNEPDFLAYHAAQLEGFSSGELGARPGRLPRRPPDRRASAGGEVVRGRPHGVVGLVARPGCPGAGPRHRDARRRAHTRLLRARRSASPLRGDRGEPAVARRFSQVRVRAHRRRAP